MRRLNRRSVVIIAMTLLMGLSVLIILYEVSACAAVLACGSWCGVAKFHARQCPCLQPHLSVLQRSCEDLPSTVSGSTGTSHALTVMQTIKTNKHTCIAAGYPSDCGCSLATPPVALRQDLRLSYIPAGA